MGYRIAVDFDLCESRGLCVESAPKIFELEADRLVIADPTPPDEMRPLVEETIQRCPQQALSLTPG